MATVEPRTCEHGVVDDVCWRCTAEKSKEEIAYLLAAADADALMHTQVARERDDLAAQLAAVVEAATYFERFAPAAHKQNERMNADLGRHRRALADLSAAARERDRALVRATLMHCSDRLLNFDAVPYGNDEEVERDVVSVIARLGIDPLGDDR